MKIKILKSGGVAGINSILFDSKHMESLAEAAVLARPTKVNTTDYFTVSVTVDDKTLEFQGMSGDGKDLPKPVYELLEYIRCNDDTLLPTKK